MELTINHFIALVYCLVFLYYKVYKSTKYNNTLIVGFIVTIFNAFLPFNYYFVGIMVFLLGLSFVVEKNLIKQLDKKEDNNTIVVAEPNDYNPIYKDYEGTVIGTYNDAHLGSIVINGTVNEIAFYSDDELQEGDHFKILGLFGNKFKAEKI